MTLASTTALLAQVTREEMGRGFRGAASQLSWTDVIPYALAIIAIIAGTVIYNHLKKRNDMSERCDDPPKLFRELCLAHQLDRGNRRLLGQLAEAFNFNQPAQIFLSPAAFESKRLPATLRNRAEDIQRLKKRLF